MEPEQGDRSEHSLYLVLPEHALTLTGKWEHRLGSIALRIPRNSRLTSGFPDEIVETERL